MKMGPKTRKWRKWAVDDVKAYMKSRKDWLPGYRDTPRAKLAKRARGSYEVYRTMRKYGRNPKRFTRHDYEDYLNELGVPQLDMRSEGGRIPDNARYGAWTRKHDPIAFNVGYNEWARDAEDRMERYGRNPYRTRRNPGYELFYSSGGHGGRYRTLREASAAANRKLGPQERRIEIRKETSESMDRWPVTKVVRYAGYAPWPNPRRKRRKGRRR